MPQLGAIVVPINFRLQPQEIKYIVDHSGAKAIAVDPALSSLIEAVRPQLESVEHFILMSAERSEGYLAYEELLAGGTPRFDAPEVSDDELLGLFYTSGTTAEPKGVMLTHKNMLSNIAHSEGVYNYQPSDIYLHAAPMFHLADGAAVFSHTSRGATQTFIPRFDPKQVLETISRERVSLLLLVPTMLNFVLGQPDLDSYDLSSLRHLTYGASPIAPDLLRRAMKILNCRFGQGYGLTEASPLLTVLTHEDHLFTDEKSERRLASCGRPVEGVDVRRPEQLAGLSGLILPGGESTTMRRLIDRWGLRDPILELAAHGAPIFGTCAGMIVLSREIAGGEAPILPLLDVTVARNAFGRQLESFEADLHVPVLGDQSVHGVFIRAPIVERTGPDVDVLARLDDGRVVAVRQRNILATAFHPELAGETRFHRLVAAMASEHEDPGEGSGRRPYPTRRSRLGR